MKGNTLKNRVTSLIAAIVFFGASIWMLTCGFKDLIGLSSPNDFKDISQETFTKNSYIDLKDYETVGEVAEVKHKGILSINTGKSAYMLIQPKNSKYEKPIIVVTTVKNAKKLLDGETIDLKGKLIEPHFSLIEEINSVLKPYNIDVTSGSNGEVYYLDTQMKTNSIIRIIGGLMMFLLMIYVVALFTTVMNTNASEEKTGLRERIGKFVASKPVAMTAVIIFFAFAILFLTKSYVFFSNSRLVTHGLF